MYTIYILWKPLELLYNDNSYILQGKTDRLLNLLIEMAYENKMKSIKTKFKSMIGSDSILMWANQFHHGISNFEDCLGGFEPQNLQQLFKHIYKIKEYICKL